MAKYRKLTAKGTSTVTKEESGAQPTEQTESSIPKSHNLVTCNTCHILKQNDSQEIIFQFAATSQAYHQITYNPQKINKQFNQ